MSGLLFVSQAMLETWAEQGKIGFAGNVLTLLAGEGKGRSYALDPAVRFLKVLGADEDPHGLVHKVKSCAQLREMGAEPVDDSCILGDAAYEVQPGFLAEGAALQAAASARPNPLPQAVQPAVAPPLPVARPPPKPAAPAAAASSSRPLGGAPLPRELEERRKEAEALARFLLDNLS
jgi:hypothetical protein